MCSYMSIYMYTHMFMYVTHTREILRIIGRVDTEEPKGPKGDEYYHRGGQMGPRLNTDMNI